MEPRRLDATGLIQKLATRVTRTPEAPPTLCVTGGALEWERCSRPPVALLGQVALRRGALLLMPVPLRLDHTIEPGCTYLL